MDPELGSYRWTATDRGDEVVVSGTRRRGRGTHGVMAEVEPPTFVKHVPNPNALPPGVGAESHRYAPLEDDHEHLFTPETIMPVDIRDRPPMVHVLAATPGKEHLVPALAGLVAQESLRRWGVLPTHDGSLSRSSRKVVDYLVSRGLMQQHPDGPGESNSLDEGPDGDVWAKSQVSMAHGLVSTRRDPQHRRLFQPHQMPADLNPNVGSQFFRQMVGASRPKRPQPDRHEQLELF